jgi:hypothetical protein
MNEQAWLRVRLKAHIYTTSPSPSPKAVDAALRGESPLPRPILPPLGKKTAQEARKECLERMGRLAPHIHDWWEEREAKGADPHRLAPMIDALGDVHAVARLLAAHGLKDVQAVAERPPAWWPEAWREAPTLPQLRGIFSADPTLWWGQMSLSLEEREEFFAPIPTE